MCSENTKGTREVFEMKKQEILKLTIAAVLCFCMAIAFIGCGDTPEQKSAEEATEETVATEPTEEASDEYYIADGITVEEENDMAVLYANGFHLTMPNTGTWTYDAETTDSLRIYYMDADSAGFGGTLVTIMAFDLDDNSYEDFPDYVVAGENKELGKRFIALFPTDVQYDPEDETQAAEYTELLNHVQTIGSSDASPFVVQ